jgi:hypothetical protein
MAGTIPSSIGVIPRHHTALMRTFRRNRMSLSFVVLPNSNLLAILTDNASLTPLQLAQVVDLGLGLAATVEIL